MSSSPASPLTLHQDADADGDQDQRPEAPDPVEVQTPISSSRNITPRPIRMKAPTGMREERSSMSGSPCGTVPGLALTPATSAEAPAGGAPGVTELAAGASRAIGARIRGKEVIEAERIGRRQSQLARPRRLVGLDGHVDHECRDRQPEQAAHVLRLASRSGWRRSARG